MDAIDALNVALLVAVLGGLLFQGWAFERRGRILLTGALACCGVLVPALMALGRAETLPGQFLAALAVLMSTLGFASTLMLLWREVGVRP
jgi:uncharacterized membrane protein